MSRRGWALFAAMSVIWGIPYLLIKIAVSDVSPIVVVFARSAVGALLLLPLALRRGHLQLLLREWKALLLYTVIELCIPWFTLSAAETRVSSSFAALLLAAIPLAAIAMTWSTTGRDRLDRTRVTGLLLGVAGVGSLVGFDVRAGDVWAVLALAVTVVGYAAGPVIFSRRLADLPGIPVVAASLGLTAILYSPFAVTSMSRHWPRASATTALITLGVVCSALAFVTFFALIREVGPARATVITYVNPVVAAIVGIAIGNEHLSTGMIAGFPLVLLGCYLATRRARPGAPGEASAGATTESAA